MLKRNAGEHSISNNWPKFHWNRMIVKATGVTSVELTLNCDARNKWVYLGEKGSRTNRMLHKIKSSRFRRKLKQSKIRHFISSTPINFSGPGTSSKRNFLNFFVVYLIFKISKAGLCLKRCKKIFPTGCSSQFLTAFTCVFLTINSSKLVDIMLHSNQLQSLDWWHRQLTAKCNHISFIIIHSLITKSRFQNLGN